MKNATKNLNFFTSVLFMSLVFAFTSTSVASTNHINSATDGQTAVLYNVTDGDEFFELKCDGKTTEAKSKEAKTGKAVKSEKNTKPAEAKSGTAVKSDKKTKATEGKCGEGKCGEGKCGEAATKESKTGKAVKSEKKAKTTEGKCGEGKCGTSKF